MALPQAPGRAYNAAVELNGKVALVTGAAKRVGRAVALELARRGAHVAVHYHGSKDQARQVAEQIRSMGPRAETLQADLASPGDIERLFAELGQAFGGLDVLVNNAAVYHRTPIRTLTAEQWDREMAVNARAPALCIRHAVPLMAHGGAVVNVADIAAEKAWPGYPAYCASKAALLALTRSAAKALAPKIRVNAVSPGVAMWSEDSDPQREKRVLSQVPMGRPGSAEDVALAVAFLAQQDYITAQNLRVDGGWHMA